METETIYTLQTIEKEETKIFKADISPEEVETINKDNPLWELSYISHCAKGEKIEDIYVMSPEVCSRVSLLAQKLYQDMIDQGFTGQDAWATDSSNNDLYMEKLLNRVNVDDVGRSTIGRNVQHITRHLLETEKDDNKPYMVRSYFTGAAIAEKYLLIQSMASGIEDINLITTDSSLHSVSYALANLEVWNQQLPKNKQFDILVVQGQIPLEYYGRSKTIILQVEDAKLAAQTDLCTNCGWDALLVDNGFPYVDNTFVDSLVTSAIENRSKDGILIAVLGLNEKIKVEIPITEKLKKIIKIGDLNSYTNKILEKTGKTTPNGYKHKYIFKKDSNNNVLITDVLSEGGARTYTWIRELLSSGDIKQALRVLNSIKKATSLSSASTEVISSPARTHERIVRILDNHELANTIIENPIDYTSYGWNIVPKNELTQKQLSDSSIWLKNSINGELKPYIAVAEEIRLQDPVVLQTSVIKVK